MVRLPSAALKESLFTLGGGTGGTDIGFEKLIVLFFLFVAVVVGVVAITKAQRRIPTQSAKHVRGRRVFGGTRNTCRCKVNQAGVMPVIFASSLLMLPRLSSCAWPALHRLALGLGSATARSNGRVYLYICLHRPDLFLLLFLDGHYLQSQGHGQ